MSDWIIKQRSLSYPLKISNKTQRVLKWRILLHAVLLVRKHRKVLFLFYWDQNVRNIVFLFPTYRIWLQNSPRTNNWTSNLRKRNANIWLHSSSSMKLNKIETIQVCSSKIHFQSHTSPNIATYTHTHVILWSIT